jgi:hypothetical protein
MDLNLPFLNQRRIIGFGAGLAALTTIETSRLTCEMLVDCSPALQGQRLAGVPIHAPTRLHELLKAGNHDAFFVIVFAYENRAIAAIFEQLSAMGLTHGKHFTDASVLHYGTMSTTLYGATGIRPDPNLFRAVRALSLYSTLSCNSSIAGSWLIQQLLRNQLATVAGDIAEAGVYKGGNSLLTLALAAGQMANRKYHLLDSFEGFPELSTHDPLSRSGEFRDVSLESIRNMFSHFDCACLHVGYFEWTLPTIANRTFALAYCDCDLYEASVECCAFFYPRMPAGGILLFHDYWHPQPGLPSMAKEPFRGIAKAVDEFCASRGEQVVRFPETTHAMIVKGGKTILPP